MTPGLPSSGSSASLPRLRQSRPGAGLDSTDGKEPNGSVRSALLSASTAEAGQNYLRRMVRWTERIFAPAGRGPFGIGGPPRVARADSRLSI
ncbi:hypothetical protein NRB56_12020 [Nocardia sp. RB56]|uniref:Uncharacterized protein n=1 Tax=Nocardia aurantia TaxID=2585199 RepID=A0A7K0DIL0_9NOCA|nr:hypothetical protein [Nocardia aurantia]